MRRAVLVVAAAALVVPLASAPAGSARAVSGTLTVTTLGQAGQRITSSPQAVNTKTHVAYYLTTGRAKRLPTGVYDVIVDVFDDHALTDTLGAKRVKVSGAVKLTFDSRAGRRVKAALRPAPPAGYQQHFLMSLCLADSPASVMGWTIGNRLYVIPSSLPTVELAYSSIWDPTDPESARPRYLGAASHAKGLPRGITTTFRQSAMATVAITARSGPQSGSPEITLSGDSDDGCRLGVLSLGAAPTLPYSYAAHVSPGFWQVTEKGQDLSFGPSRPYRAGHTYHLTINRAVWGPDGSVPFTFTHRLYLNTTDMFTDPYLNYGPHATTSYRLTRHGKTIYARTVGGGNDEATVAPVLRSRGWYTLVESARRRPTGGALPADALSTRSTLTLHFFADPATERQVRAYLTRFLPLGLDAHNRARPGTSTTVHLSLRRPPSPDGRRLPDSVRKVMVWASTDDGRTWHGLRVRHGAGGWTTAVRNPAHGMVSLRSRVYDTHGGNATTTVIRAYAVGRGGATTGVTTGATGSHWPASSTT